MHKQLNLHLLGQRNQILPFNTQLFKWIGNKQRFAHEIISYFPDNFGVFYEPFLGSGAVLGTLAPNKAVASDILCPLIDVWKTLVTAPNTVKEWYEERYEHYYIDPNNTKVGYEEIKASYNKNPNGPDLLFLSRSCYGGVVRFRKADGYMSTPCGIHKPVSPHSFSNRVNIWHERVKNTTFVCEDFQKVMNKAVAGDLIYCDPPYVDTQSIIYGAQNFDLQRLFSVIKKCKERGVYVVLSIDGTKKTGNKISNFHIPDGLFEHVASVNCGRSMLRRFQMNGKTLENEVVTDRLLLTY